MSFHEINSIIYLLFALTIPSRASINVEYVKLNIESFNQGSKKGFLMYDKRSRYPYRGRLTPKSNYIFLPFMLKLGTIRKIVFSDEI